MYKTAACCSQTYAAKGAAAAQQAEADLKANIFGVGGQSLVRASGGGGGGGGGGSAPVPVPAPAPAQTWSAPAPRSAPEPPQTPVPAPRQQQQRGGGFFGLFGLIGR